VTRSPSLSVALQRLREQVKIEATVPLDAACGATRSALEALRDARGKRWAEQQTRVHAQIPPGAISWSEWQKQLATQPPEVDEWTARRDADRLYKRTMSQASQSIRSEYLGKEWWRLRLLAAKSLHEADQAMRLAGLRPESHRRRAMAVRRMVERGMMVDDGD
jgi:hypothetical protein